MSPKVVALRYIIYCSTEVKRCPSRVKGEGYQLLKNPLGSSIRWKQMILFIGGILDFSEGVLFQFLPEGGEVRGEGGLGGAVGLV